MMPADRKVPLSTRKYSVPAMLRKGPGAKEIGHTLAHEQLKFRHNLVRKRHKIGHSLRLRMTK